MEELEQPIINLIQSKWYVDFMYRARTDNLGDSFDLIRRGHVEFPIQDTVRTAWNRLCIQKPIFCGWLHEHPSMSMGVLNCKHRWSSCCGHLEASQIFHTIGVGGYLAHTIDPTLTHPGNIIEKTVQDDTAFQVWYGVSRETGYYFDPIPVSEIPRVRFKLQNRQIKTYHTVTRPYIMRVGEILRNQSR